MCYPRVCQLAQLLSQRVCPDQPTSVATCPQFHPTSSLIRDRKAISDPMSGNFRVFLACSIPSLCRWLREVLKNRAPRLFVTNNSLWDFWLLELYSSLIILFQNFVSYSLPKLPWYAGSSIHLNVGTAVKRVLCRDSVLIIFCRDEWVE